MILFLATEALYGNHRMREGKAGKSLKGFKRGSGADH